MFVRPAVVLFSIAAAPFALGVTARAAGEKQPPAVHVTGQGEVAAAPDQVEITVGVVTENQSAAEAVRANSQAMQQLMSTLNEAGIAKKSIQTTSFNVSPQRQHEPQRTPQITGYQAINQVLIKLDKIDQLGELLDSLIGAGANEIQGIHFSVSNRDKLLDEARQAAVQAARRKAELYAEATGARLGRVLSISEMDGGPQPYAARQLSMEAAGSVPISPGEQTLSVAVSLSYRLISGEE